MEHWSSEEQPALLRSPLISVVTAVRAEVITSCPQTHGRPSKPSHSERIL